MRLLYADMVYMFKMIRVSKWKILDDGRYEIEGQLFANDEQRLDGDLTMQQEMKKLVLTEEEIFHVYEMDDEEEEFELDRSNLQELHNKLEEQLQLQSLTGSKKGSKYQK